MSDMRCPYDTVVAGGHVIDPATGTDAIADVAIRDGKIAAVGHSLAAQAREVIDVTGCLVTPGLVDMHTHLDLVPGPWGVDASTLIAATGATSWIDAGSAGAERIGELSQAAALLPVDVRALLHVSATGLDRETGESAQLGTLSVEAALDAAAEQQEFVVGVKVRIDGRAVGELGLEPLRRAVSVARQAQLPLMVHVALGPPDVAQVLPYLERGDILTHCASGKPTDILSAGHLAPHVLAAHDRGVLFDIGHGNGSFAFAVLDAYLRQEIVPICSSDINAPALGKGGALLPEVMSKLLASGVPLRDVVDATTRRPALTLGIDAGTLRTGARADVTVFRVLEGTHTLTDRADGERIARQLLVPVVTIVRGHPIPAENLAVPPTAGATPNIKE